MSCDTCKKVIKDNLDFSFGEGTTKALLVRTFEKECGDKIEVNNSPKVISDDTIGQPTGCQSFTVVNIGTAAVTVKFGSYPQGLTLNQYSGFTVSDQGIQFSSINAGSNTGNATAANQVAANALLTDIGDNTDTLETLIGNLKTELQNQNYGKQDTFNDVAAHAAHSYREIVVLTPAVFTSVMVGDEELVGEGEAGVSGCVLAGFSYPAGFILRCPGSTSPFTSIQLASGAISCTRV